MATLRWQPRGRLSGAKTCRNTVPQPCRSPTSGEYRAKDARIPWQGRSLRTSSRGFSLAILQRSCWTLSKAEMSWPAATKDSLKGRSTPGERLCPKWSLLALPAQSDAQSSVGSWSNGGVASPGFRRSYLNRPSTSQTLRGPMPHRAMTGSWSSSSTSFNVSSSHHARSNTPWSKPRSRMGSASEGLSAVSPRRNAEAMSNLPMPGWNAQPSGVPPSKHTLNRRICGNGPRGAACSM
mmetsp:Transcript_56683/g.162666  ORF Transcript_56683/g.162666 Transcript_56683/m.162666 type:complete len:237 (-) Transcript_56683:98-808(-)